MLPEDELALRRIIVTAAVIEEDGKFLVTRLEYAGDFNGERNYTLALESSGEVVAL